jgi:cytochrome c553
MRYQVNNMNALIGVKVFFIGALVVGVMTAQADIATGQSQYASCVACHGVQAEGKSELNAPALSGQSADYLLRQLKNFKAGIRGSDASDTLGAQMRSIAATLPDEEAMTNLSEYIASLPSSPQQKLVEGDLHKGNNIYQGNCGSCHGNQAEGNPQLYAPRLAGLDADYLIRQFNNYKKGIRGSHPDDRYGKQMKFMASSLGSDQDLQDVVAFILTLPVK